MAPKKPKKSKKPEKKLSGFERAGQKDAESKIKRLLAQAQSYLAQAEEIDSRLYSHVNRDDSIDGELKVNTIRGISSKHLFMAVEAGFPGRSGLSLIWISVGVRFSYQNEDDPYTRYKGHSQIQTNYRRYTAAKKALVFLTARVIAERVEKRSRRKIDHLFVRLHWNPDNRQPKRK